MPNYNEINEMMNQNFSKEEIAYALLERTRELKGEENAEEEAKNQELSDLARLATTLYSNSPDKQKRNLGHVLKAFTSSNQGNKEFNYNTNRYRMLKADALTAKVLRVVPKEQLVENPTLEDFCDAIKSISELKKTYDRKSAFSWLFSSEVRALGRRISRLSADVKTLTGERAFDAAITALGRNPEADIHAMVHSALAEKNIFVYENQEAVSRALEEAKKAKDDAILKEADENFRNGTIKINMIPDEPDGESKTDPLNEARIEDENFEEVPVSKKEPAVQKDKEESESKDTEEDNKANPLEDFGMVQSMDAKDITDDVLRRLMKDYDEIQAYYPEYAAYIDKETRDFLSSKGLNKAEIGILLNSPDDERHYSAAAYHIAQASAQKKQVNTKTDTTKTESGASANPLEDVQKIQVMSKKELTPAVLERMFKDLDEIQVSYPEYYNEVSTTISRFLEENGVPQNIITEMMFLTNDMRNYQEIAELIQDAPEMHQDNGTLPLDFAGMSKGDMIALFRGMDNLAADNELGPKWCAVRSNIYSNVDIQGAIDSHKYLLTDDQRRIINAFVVPKFDAKTMTFEQYADLMMNRRVDLPLNEKTAELIVLSSYNPEQLQEVSQFVSHNPDLDYLKTALSYKLEQLADSKPVETTYNDNKVMVPSRYNFIAKDAMNINVGVISDSALYGVSSYSAFGKSVAALSQDRRLRDLEGRMNVIRKVDEMKKNPADQKGFAVEENKENQELCIKMPKMVPQETNNGCWSCSLSAILNNEGVKLTPKEVRSYRPDVDGNISDKNMSLNMLRKRIALASRATFDVMNSEPDYVDLIHKTVKNAAVHHLQVEKDAFIPTVIAKLDQYKKPISVTNGSHYITIIGHVGGKLIYQDSLIDKHVITGQTYDADVPAEVRAKYKDYCVSNSFPVSDGKRAELLWIEKEPDPASFRKTIGSKQYEKNANISDNVIAFTETDPDTHISESVYVSKDVAKQLCVGPYASRPAEIAKNEIEDDDDFTLFANKDNLGKEPVVTK